MAVGRRWTRFQLVANPGMDYASIRMRTIPLIIFESWSVARAWAPFVAVSTEESGNLWRPRWRQWALGVAPMGARRGANAGRANAIGS